MKFPRLWSKFRDSYSKINSEKMPQNMKPSDRFRTVSDSAVLCQIIPPPYSTLKAIWKFLAVELCYQYSKRKRSLLGVSSNQIFYFLKPISAKRNSVGWNRPLRATWALLFWPTLQATSDLIWSCSSLTEATFVKSLAFLKFELTCQQGRSDKLNFSIINRLYLWVSAIFESC